MSMAKYFIKKYSRNKRRYVEITDDD